LIRAFVSKPALAQRLSVDVTFLEGSSSGRRVCPLVLGQLLILGLDL